MVCENGINKFVAMLKHQCLELNVKLLWFCHCYASSSEALVSDEGDPSDSKRTE